jgi:hypothetical protein
LNNDIEDYITKIDGFRHIYRYLGLQVLWLVLVYLTSNREHMASNYKSIKNLKGHQRKWLWSNVR